jgi:serine/threonine-protein kinase TTK/MPS1
MGQHLNHMPASVLQPVKHSQRAVSLPMTRAAHPLMSLDPQRVVTVNGKKYISLDGEIGKGQSSRVHKVVGEDMQIYAIKEVKFRDLDDPCIPGYLQEVELLKTLQGEPFIIK